MNFFLETLKVLLLTIYLLFESIILWLIPSRRKNVAGELVLITGAGSGIGRLMALQFARLGATLVLWDINEEGNKETSRLAKKNGAVRVHTYTLMQFIVHILRLHAIALQSLICFIEYELATLAAAAQIYVEHPWGYMNGAEHCMGQYERADKVCLCRIRGKRTRRGRHRMKIGDAEPRLRRPSDRDRPPLGYIGGLSTALQNAVDKPLMPVASAHILFFGIFLGSLNIKKLVTQS
ncbi:unnamed protein product [Ranitomeya imitator]|uniref:Uncharacterized protein n=1 Tax=Ranitomeya imitator TaxID=111125 RepID=A0ABN9KVJ4_9NEOB|nr:unnamed protein product [Ranitomeya imitator]